MVDISYFDNKEKKAVLWRVIESVYQELEDQINWYADTDENGNKVEPVNPYERDKYLAYKFVYEHLDIQM